MKEARVDTFMVLVCNIRDISRRTCMGGKVRGLTSVQMYRRLEVKSVTQDL